MAVFAKRIVATGVRAVVALAGASSAATAATPAWSPAVDLGGTYAAAPSVAIRPDGSGAVVRSTSNGRQTAVHWLAPGGRPDGRTLLRIGSPADVAVGARGAIAITGDDPAADEVPSWWVSATGRYLKLHVTDQDLLAPMVLPGGPRFLSRANDTSLGAVLLRPRAGHLVATAPSTPDYETNGFGNGASAGDAFVTIAEPGSVGEGEQERWGDPVVAAFTDGSAPQLTTVHAVHPLHDPVLDAAGDGTVVAAGITASMQHGTLRPRRALSWAIGSPAGLGPVHGLSMDGGRIRGVDAVALPGGGAVIVWLYSVPDRSRALRGRPLWAQIGPAGEVVASGKLSSTTDARDLLAAQIGDRVVAIWAERMNFDPRARLQSAVISQDAVRPIPAPAGRPLGALLHRSRSSVDLASAGSRAAVVFEDARTHHIQVSHLALR